MKLKLLVLHFCDKYMQKYTEKTAKIFTIILFIHCFAVVTLVTQKAVVLSYIKKCDKLTIGLLCFSFMLQRVLAASMTGIYWSLHKQANMTALVVLYPYVVLASLPFVCSTCKILNCFGHTFNFFSKQNVFGCFTQFVWFFFLLLCQPVDFLVSKPCVIAINRPVAKLVRNKQCMLNSLILFTHVNLQFA